MTIEDEIEFLKYKRNRTIKNIQKNIARIVGKSELNEERNMELHNAKVENFRRKYPDIYIEVDHFNKCVNFKRKLAGLSEQKALRVRISFDMQFEQVGPQNGTFVMDCMEVAKVYVNENISSSNKTLLND